MNIGFFAGFSVAGHYQLTENYSGLFVFATIGNIVAIILAGMYWKTIADRDTPLLQVDAGKFRRRFALGTVILVGLVPVVWFLLQHPYGTETLVKAISGLVALALAWLAYRHRDARERNNMWAYLILTTGSLVYSALYMMAPSGLQLFAVSNVDRNVWGIEVAPQWIQNINSVVIVVGGPLLSALFVRLRARGFRIDIPKQFSASLITMGLGFLALPAGIALADRNGMVAFSWLFASYVLQSIAELLISPVGYAMIGKLAPRQYQGVMMGAWMLVTGLASLFAGDFSGMVPEPSEGPPRTTNHTYSTLFAELGCGSLLVGVVLVVLIPFLRKLISDEEKTPSQDPLAPGQAAA
jgi:POT family proton-dependent oligopeptide transporter